MNIKEIVRGIHIIARNLDTSINAIAYALEFKNIIKAIDRQRIIDYYNNVFYTALCNEQVTMLFKEKELKSCPFCGSKAIRVQNPGHNWDGKEGKHINIGACYGLWYVGCPSTFYEDSVPACEIAPAAKWFADLAEAERVWNKQK